MTACIQILLDLKSADPTALTAGEAIRHLLGLGDRLAEIRRRQLHELLVSGPPVGRPASSPDPADTPGGLPEAEQALGLISDYLARSVLFWNPNKHRAWARLPLNAGTPVREASASGLLAAASFGLPDLDDPEFDHLLVWPRNGTAAPEDLAAALRPHSLSHYFRAEVYSLRWKGAGSAAERLAWTESVSVVRGRREGLLVNPHFQEHRILQGLVPIPVGPPGA